MPRDWFYQRNRGVFLTIRDVDCAGFDARRLANDLAGMHVTYAQFFASGYVTVYPTALADLRVSPWLGGRDLAGDIVAAVHERGIKAVPVVELTLIPEEIGRRHPDWCARNADGTLQSAGEGLLAACPLCEYVRSYSRQMIGEILGRYEVDGIYLTGVGWRDRVCFCERCRADFHAHAGRPIPEATDWDDPAYRHLVRWRLEKTTEMSRLVVAHVRSFDSELPVISGGVYFGDPHWTTRAAFDFEAYTACQDGLFSEAQTRLWAGGLEGRTRPWQPFIWAGEAARYLDSIGRGKPVIVTASYFMAWPWRRSAAPALEQKTFAAQIAANGGTIKLNLSGGPPSVHNDRRGFPAIRELFGFLSRNDRYYQGDSSAADVALVHSRDTFFFYGRDRIDERYLDEMRGLEQALLEAHVPFDIISTGTLSDAAVLVRYKVLVLPNLACLSEKEADLIRDYSRSGGGVVATHETSLYDPDGLPRKDFALADLFHASHGRTRDVMAPAGAEAPADSSLRQAYLEIEEARHPLLDGIVDTEVIPVIGQHCAVELRGAAVEVPLRLGASFRVFPEGYSYPVEPAPRHPMAIAARREGAGRVVYFPFQVGTLFWRAGIEDLAVLAVNAVRWAGSDPDLNVKAPSTVHVSLRTKGNLRIVHLINLTGGRRFFRQLVPVRDIEVGLRCARLQGVSRLGAGASLPARERDGRWWVTVDRLEDYEVVVFDCGAAAG